MDLDAYVAEHNAEWRRLEYLTGRRRLDAAEVDELVALYQRSATHLSALRARAPEPALVNRLSHLVLAARARVTGRQRFSGAAGGRFARFEDLSAHGDVPAPEETGRTFRANACLKASYYATRLGVWALADDSGLEVDALEGSPGVHSARWAQRHGEGKGDAENNRLLLKQLEGIGEEKRTARFVCVLALSDPEGRVVMTARDTVEGRILVGGPRGTNGFGYDPLFLVPELGRTAAELDPEQKHAISHRGKALRRLRELLDAALA